MGKNELPNFAAKPQGRKSITQSLNLPNYSIPELRTDS